MKQTVDRPTWLPYETYPFELRSVDLPSGTVTYIDEGEGPTLLFVHAGMWSFVWREAVIRLRGEFRTVALDFPGCGVSGGEPVEFTLDAFSAIVAEFVAALGLNDVTLVAHDLGGPVGLDAAAADASRYSALVLTNTFAWDPDQPTLRGMLKTMGSAAVESLDASTNFLPVIASTRYGVGRHLDRAGKAAFRGPYRDRDRRRIIHRLMYSATSSPELMARIEAAAKGSLNHLPVLTIFGAHNDPWHFQDRHAATFPDHEGHAIPKSYHFPMMDNPDRFADLIRDWVTPRRELVTSPDGQRGSIAARRGSQPSAAAEGG